MKLEIKKHVPIAKDVYEMVLDCNVHMKPGQFINIKINDSHIPFLRRPISVANIEGGELTIIYKVFGEGTKELSQRKVGEELDCLLSLGNGFDISIKEDSILLVGGGCGVPPLFYLAKELSKKGKKITSVLGFSSKEDVFLEKRLGEYGDVFVTTDDGSYGIKGNVMDIIKDLDFDYYMTCGPEAMLLALKSNYPKNGQLSFEERMGCGFGACMGCSCETLTGYKRICVEGPVIKVEELI